MTCDARIRPMRPVNDVELTCSLVVDHDRHAGELRDYAKPGSLTIISWDEHDRRNFRGDWIECPIAVCILPAGHRGAHAT